MRKMSGERPFSCGLETPRSKLPMFISSNAKPLKNYKMGDGDLDDQEGLNYENWKRGPEARQINA